MTEGGTGGAASYGIVVSISIPVQADLPTDLDMLYHDDAIRARPALPWVAELVLYQCESKSPLPHPHLYCSAVAVRFSKNASKEAYVAMC